MDRPRPAGEHDAGSRRIMRRPGGGVEVSAFGSGALGLRIRGGYFGLPRDALLARRSNRASYLASGRPTATRRRVDEVVKMLNMAASLGFWG